MSLVEVIIRADASAIADSKNPLSVSPPPLVSHSSVGETDSVASTHSLSKKRERDDEALAEQRKSANRRSAYQSRLRKKLLIEELQEKVSDLMEQLDTLGEDNKSLCHRLESALAENRHLRYSQQESLIMSQAGGMHGLPMMNMGVFSNPGGLGISGASISALLNGKVPGGGFDSSSLLY
jgi:hypothetical protein